MKPRAGEKDSLYIDDGDVNYCRGNQYGFFFQRLQIELSYNPDTLLLSIYPKELKSLCAKKCLQCSAHWSIINNIQSVEST